MVLGIMLSQCNCKSFTQKRLASTVSDLNHVTLHIVYVLWVYF